MELEQELSEIRKTKDVEGLLDQFSDYCYWVGKMYERGEIDAPGYDIDEGKRVFWERLRELVGDDESEPLPFTRRTLGENDVREGMRFVTVNPADNGEGGLIPEGETGTIVLPDTDGAPGVSFDNAVYNTLSRSIRKIATDYVYVNVWDIEQIPDEE